MKSILFTSVFSIILVASLIGFAYGEQTNIHVSMFPLIDADIRDGRQISTRHISMHGERIDLSGIDINTIYRKAISDTRAYNSTIGAALLGNFVDGEMKSDTYKRDLSGIVLHGSYNMEYLVAKKPSSNLILFTGIPLSFGSFTVENIYYESVTFYNILAGLQGGARLDLNAGNFIASPLVMVNLMGGYGERYEGGVYYENLHSEGIPIFASASSGLEIIYLPLNLKLSGIYQRTFESGDNEAIDTATIQLGLSL